MLSVFIGLIVVLLGLWGLVNWWENFLMVLKGAFPVCFLFGGLVAVIAGIMGLRDRRKINLPAEEQTKTNSNTTSPSVSK